MEIIIILLTDYLGRPVTNRIETKANATTNHGGVKGFTRCLVE